MRHGIRKSFLLQATLILLPVLLLAAYGLWALRAERQQLEEETRQTATLISDELGPLLGQLLSKSFSDYSSLVISAEEILRMSLGDSIRSPGVSISNSVDQAMSRRKTEEIPGIDYAFSIVGRCIITTNTDVVPRQFASVPSPPEWLTTLTSSEWAALQFNCQPVHSEDMAESCLKQFDGLIVAITNIELRAELELERLFVAPGDQIAESAFLDFVGRYPDVVGSAGVPLADLAMTHYIRSLQGGKEIDPRFWALASQRIRSHPSMLTKPWMELALNLHNTGNFPEAVNSSRIKSLFNAYEYTRAILRIFPRDVLTKGFESPVWFDSGATDYLAVPVGVTPGSDGPEKLYVMNLYPGGNAETLLAYVSNQISTRVPRFFSLRFKFGNRSINIDLRNPKPNRGGPVEEPLVTGSTMFRIGNDPTEAGITIPFEITLTDRTALFKNYHRRVGVTGTLIALAVVAAFVGLWQTLTNLRHQVALNEMKTNFVSSVSHELRAPIASVRLMAENLQQGKVTGEAKLKEYVGFIGQECRRLSSLIENVLDFSRIEQGRKQYELEPTDLAQLVGDRVRLMIPYAEERDVQLAAVIGDPTEGRHSCRPVGVQNHGPGDKNVAAPYELNLDGRAMQQALINLIDNAIKHSPAGETVEVRLQRRTGILPVTGESSKLTNVRTSTKLRNRNEADRMSVLLTVTDHGPGIPVEEHSKIFERFYRRGSELRRETQGIGIGLSIVKHIVEGHGGKVWVESKPGEGSRFIIQFQPQMDTDKCG